MSRQQELKELWLAGPQAQLCALEEAKAWALREVWQADCRGAYGMHAFIAGKVRKGDGTHPSREAVRRLFQKMDDDEGWFPWKAVWREAWTETSYRWHECCGALSICEGHQAGRW